MDCKIASFFLLSLVFNPFVSSQTVYVVLRDVPQSPSVVVIPTSFSNKGLEYADRIEENLISFRIKVVQRPSIRQITETKGATVSEGGAVDAARSGKSQTDQYIAYEETGADYVLLTDENAERVKLIRSGTREILATASGLDDFLEGQLLNEFEAEASKLGIEDKRVYRIYRLLKSAGLPVRRTGQ